MAENLFFPGHSLVGILSESPLLVCSRLIEKLRQDDIIDDMSIVNEGDNRAQDASSTEPMDIDIDIEVDKTQPCLQPDENNNENEQANGEINEEYHGGSPIEVSIEQPKLDDPAFVASMEFYTFLKKKKLSRDGIDGATKIVDKCLAAVCPGAEPLYSHYKARTGLLKAFPVKGQQLDVCRDGCKLYFEDDQDRVCNNESCLKPRYKVNPKTNEGTCACTMTYLPLIEQLALLVSEEELLQGSKNAEKDPDVMYDFTDDALGKSLSKIYSKSKDRLTLYLGLYSDGYQIFKNGKHTMTVFNLIILNLPGFIRTENKYMIQVCAAPGPKAPVDLFSFTKSIMRELTLN
ncbi:hypothetical protein K501DRAFT_266032 [Backusella circina FSU 941]|nr:hypothetical protein K501DRAFT_266032 [Backusella circina FSU 941]